MQDSTFSTRARIVLLAPALAVFCAFWLLPLVALLQASAVPDAFSAYREVLTNARYLHSLLATVALSLAVTAATLVLSTVAGLFLARRELPDVVLIDLMLPDIDGFSVCEILRSQPSTSKVPIIVVSALDGEYVRSRGIKAGVVCCFKKPVDMKVLGESIRSNYELRQESVRLELAEDDRRRK